MTKYPTLVCNQGLGDAIVIAGAAVYLSESFGGIRFPCMIDNRESVDSMFVNHPRVHVYTIQSETELRLTHVKSPIQCYWIRVEGVIIDPTISWDRWMYQKLHVPFERRWESCPIEEAWKLVPQVTPVSEYIFHEDTERGFSLSTPEMAKFSGAKVYQGIDLRKDFPSILSWVQVLKQAKEIHVIDSCVWHLVESLDGIRANLYLHRYARLRKPIWHDVATKYKWTVIV